MDINSFCQEQWPALKQAVQRAIRLEPDPDRKADMEDELADFATELAADFAPSGYPLPEPDGTFLRLLRDAHRDAQKEKELREIFAESVRAAGEAAGFTERVVEFLGKYGRFLPAGGL